MWVQCSDDEFRAKIEKERREFIIPIACFVVCQLLGILYALGMPDDFGETVGPVPFIQYLEKLPLISLASLAIAIGVFCYNYFLHDHYSPKWLQCTKCSKTISVNSDENSIEYNTTEAMLCKCGGNLIDLRKFKWIEDKNNKSE
jgi:hypothetical protein